MPDAAAKPDPVADAFDAAFERDAQMRAKPMNEELVQRVSDAIDNAWADAADSPSAAYDSKVLARAAIKATARWMHDYLLAASGSPTDSS